MGKFGNRNEANTVGRAGTAKATAGAASRVDAAKERFTRTRVRSFLAGGQQEVNEEDSVSRTPERALMLAVLEDAIACYAGRLKAPRENPLILRRQAQHWLVSDDWESPFSFNNVCDSLALDPTSLRSRILVDPPAQR